jgi:hypothetical protein
MPHHKTENTTRMYFVNVNGLRFGPQGGDSLDACASMHTAHIDILEVAETKLDTHKRNVLTTCANAARRVFSFPRVFMSSNAFSYRNHYKPGTSLIAAAWAFCPPQKQDHSGDYNKVFNGENFVTWWKNQSLPNLHQDSVIYLDTAKYHKVPAADTPKAYKMKKTRNAAVPAGKKNS